MRFSLLLVLAVAASGCVRGYDAIAYDSPEFVTANTDEGLTFAYLYDAQPGYYGRKANDRGYSIVAVRVANETAAPVLLDRNTLQIRYGDETIVPVRPDIVADDIDQPVLNKLLWGLLNVTFYSGSGDPTFIPSGPFLAGGFIIASMHNNGRMEDGLVEGDLFGQTVPAGGAVEGVITIRRTGRPPLTFDVVPDATPAATLR